MRMFITSKNKYLSNDMNIFGTYSIPLTKYTVEVIYFLYNIIIFVVVQSLEPRS